MSESESPRLIVIVAVAAAAGIVVTLLAQFILGNGPNADVAKAAGKGESQRIEALEAQLKALQQSVRPGRENKRPAGAPVSALGDNKEPQGQEVAEAEKKEEEKNPLLEFMMALGAQKSKTEVSGEVAKLTERLNLNETQQEQLTDLLMARTKKQQEAGMLMLSGKASLSDLLAADENNFSEVDAAMADLLSGEQLEDYNTYSDEREIKRIEKKSNEDLDGLRNVAELSAQQEDEAFDIFVELNAAEKPGSLPEGTTVEEFNGYIDQAINNRIERLEPILSEQQLGSYRVQAEGFGKMISALISGGTGNP
ncbi:MAG: hypothetical protein VCA55_03340 [Verrucomicrobiales bacterium]